MNQNIFRFLCLTGEMPPTQQIYRCRQSGPSCSFALAADVCTSRACTSRRCSCTGTAATSWIRTTWVDCTLTTQVAAETTSFTSVTIAAPRWASLWDRSFNIATPCQVLLVNRQRTSLELEASWLDVLCDSVVIDASLSVSMISI